MSIENPSVFWLLLFLVPIGLIYVFRYEKNKKSLNKLIGKWRYNAFVNIYLVKTFFSMLFFFLFIIFAILSLSGIVVGKKLIEEDRSGYEIMIAFDVSRSMLARDVSPSRIERAVLGLKNFIANLSEARFGIVIFKGDAACILPLTDDIHSINMILENLGPDLMMEPGTNIAKGLDISLKSFCEAGRFKSILLFTDGEYLDGSPLGIAKQCGRLNIPIIPVAMGTENGGRIILAEGGYLINDNSEVVISRLNMDVLEEIADLSGGKVFKYDEIHKISDELIFILKNLEPGEWGQGLKLVGNNLYKYFLFFSLLFLILSLLVKVVRWKRLM